MSGFVEPWPKTASLDILDTRELYIIPPNLKRADCTPSDETREPAPRANHCSFDIYNFGHPAERCGERLVDGRSVRWGRKRRGGKLVHQHGVVQSTKKRPVHVPLGSLRRATRFADTGDAIPTAGHSGDTRYNTTENV